MLVPSCSSSLTPCPLPRGALTKLSSGSQRKKALVFALDSLLSCLRGEVGAIRRSRGKTRLGSAVFERWTNLSLWLWVCPAVHQCDRNVFFPWLFISWKGGGGRVRPDSPP